MKSGTLFLIMIMVILGTLLITKTTKDTKYKITAPEFPFYYVDDYNITDNCVNFNYNESNRKFCGVFQVIKLKD